MSFDNPVALALILFIPLLLLMKRRRTRVQRQVANLYLWQESSARDANTLAKRLRRDWLLILQAAVLASVAFAMAQPHVGAGARAAAFVFDTSLSMSARQGEQTRFDLAKERAAALLDQLPSGSRVSVMAADADARLVGHFSAGDRGAADAVRSLQPTDGRANLPAAIDRARAAVPAPERIYVFTDAAAAPAASAQDVEVITVGQPADNTAITVLSARRSADRSDLLHILVTVANHGQARVDTLLRLTRNTEEVARQPIELQPRSSASFEFTTDGSPGTLVAELALQDTLAADNARRLVVLPFTRTRVWLPSTSGFFVDNALAVHPEFVRVASIEEADVVVCHDCSSLPSGNAGVLLLTASSDATEPAAVLSMLDTDHPIADGLELDGAIATLHGGPAPPAGAAVLARGNSGPALFAYEADSRRIADMRVDLASGPFPLSPAFPVFFANAIRWLGNRDRNPATLSAGDPLRWRLDPQASPVVLGPHGQPIRSAFNDGLLSAADTTTAGIYEVRLASGRHTVVVNPVVDGEADLSEAALVPASAAAQPGSVDERRPARSIATFLVLAALLFLAFESRHALRVQAPRRRFVVRCAVASLLVLALVGVNVPAGTSPIAVMFAVDISNSMGISRAETLNQLKPLASRLRREDRAGVVVFGARAVVERSPGPPDRVGPQLAATTPGAATDIESALRLARSALPREGARRIVLLSDGQETLGDAAREASLAAAEGVAVDVVTPRFSSIARLAVSRLAAPPHAAVGEPFAVTAVARGPAGRRAELIINGGEGNRVTREVRFGRDGSVSETLTTVGREPGLQIFRAGIRSLEDDVASDVFESSAGAVVTVSGRPRVLVVGAHADSLRSLLSSSYDVHELTPQRLPRSASALGRYDAVVLDDVGGESLEAMQVSALIEHVETRGAGLFVLGSARTLDATLRPDTGLGRALPIDLRPRAGVRAPELALVVVFDKSGSMDERVGGVARIDIARQSIRRVLETVPATDSVGVIAFDRVPTVVAPLRAGNDPDGVSDQLRTMTSSGGTAIAPAVELARQWLASAPAAARRHVILVSDGRSAPADAARLKALVQDGGFRLSVISLGADRDQEFLSTLASTSGGRAIFPDDERQLPAIAAREAARVAGGGVVEERFVPRASSHPVLTAIDRRAFPALTGYVVSAAKRSAEVVLMSHRDDPIVATWQYGVGRVAVYTADLFSTWSDAMRRSAVLEPLVTQTVRWLARPAVDDTLYLRFRPDGTSVRIVLDARTDDVSYATGLDARATVQPPTGERQLVSLAETVPGRYEGSFTVSDTGAYMVSLEARGRDGLSNARVLRGFFWTGDQEYRASGINHQLLSQITGSTGGVLIDELSEPFVQRPRAYRDAGLWLLGAAFLLFLSDLVGPGIVHLIRSRVHRQPITSAQAAA